MACLAAEIHAGRRASQAPWPQHLKLANHAAGIGCQDENASISCHKQAACMLQVHSIAELRTRPWPALVALCGAPCARAVLVVPIAGCNRWDCAGGRKLLCFHIKSQVAGSQLPQHCHAPMTTVRSQCVSTFIVHVEPLHASTCYLWPFSAVTALAFLNTMTRFTYARVQLQIC